MKKKFHTLPIIRYYAGGGVLLLFLIMVFISGMLFTATFLYGRDWPIDDLLSVLFLGCSLPSVWIILMHVAFWEKCFAYIIVTDEAIIWKCAFRKSIKILRSDCKYVGLEFETSAIPLEYPYIYFTSLKYPDPYYKGPIKVKCKEGLIKFRYTPDLAEYVRKEFSSITTYAFCSYYRKNQKSYIPDKKRKKKDN